MIDPNESQEVTVENVLAVMRRAQRAATGATKKTRMAFQAPPSGKIKLPPKKKG